MALYLGVYKVKININDILYCLNIPSINKTRLLSSDRYVLKGAGGLYLVPKCSMVDNIMLTADNYILTDVNGRYLITKESE
jgi:hypothetical protein